MKTFNHLGYYQMEDLAHPFGKPERIALGVTSDDTAAGKTVMTFVDAAGFDPIYIGTLEHSAVLHPKPLSSAR